MYVHVYTYTYIADRNFESVKIPICYVCRRAGPVAGQRKGGPLLGGEVPPVLLEDFRILGWQGIWWEAGWLVSWRFFFCQTDAFCPNEVRSQRALFHSSCQGDGSPNVAGVDGFRR